jgi:phage terminase large subunit
MSKRIRAVPGGTSASKTISIVQILTDLAQSDSIPTLTSIVSESMPHLKKGCIRDFKKIMKEHGYWKEARWAETDKVYTFETGSQIEFFGADQADKLRGGRRDRLFINEANNVEFAAFEELEVRTKEFVFLDWNPTNEFWYYTEVKGIRDDVEELTLTYKDNEALDEQIKASIEQRRGRKGWYTVYGLGQLGEVEGKIYRGWKIIDEVPHEAKLDGYGLDFGFTNDPTTIVAVYKYNGGVILDEVMWQKGASNKQIVDVLETQEKALTVADSAEPKSIDEIKSYGITIVPSVKGQDSVKAGIQFIQGMRISVTKRSVHIIKDYRNYLWETDANGQVLNIPEHAFSHTMDAIRYKLAYKMVKEAQTIIWTRPKQKSNPAR